MSFLRGDHHPNWKGGRIFLSIGYVKIWCPDHRLADCEGYVLEHRLVWESYNKASLLSNGVVHHINEVRSDNRPENLKAMTVKEHSILHHHREDPSDRICCLCDITNEQCNPENKTSQWYRFGDLFICKKCYKLFRYHVFGIGTRSQRKLRKKGFPNHDSS